MPIKITSRFTPFTYDEITKPLVQQTEAQRAMEDTYMDLSTQAAQYASMANQETDPVTYQKLKSYSDDLKAQAENLVAHGLQTGSRRALLNMRSRYANDIVPIETAIKRRSELANEQRKLRASNPDLMFQRDMGTVSLDELVSNPQLDYGKSYSGAQIQKDVSDMVTAVAGSLGSIAAGGNIDPYTKEIINKSGFTVDQIQQALASGVNGNEVLNQIAKGVLNKTGIYEWGDNATQRRAEQYATNGFWSGMEQVKRSTMADHARIRQDQVVDRNAQMALHGFKPDGKGGYTYDAQLAAQINGYSANSSATEADINGAKAFKAGVAENNTQLYQKVENGPYFILKQTADGKGKEFVPTTLTPKKAALSTQEQQREEWDKRYKGIIRLSEDFSTVNGDETTEETRAYMSSKLSKAGDTKYRTFEQLTPNQQANLENVFKGSGYSPTDYYYVQAYRGSNRVIAISKDVISDRDNDTAEDYIPEYIRKGFGIED